MQVKKLKSKIHNIPVFNTKVHYHGSCFLGHELMKKGNISCYEQIHIYNVTNGNRFVTYALLDNENSEKVTVLGAAAHLVDISDLLIICTYALFEENEYHEPVVLNFSKE